MKIKKKNYLETNVYEEAKTRIKYLYSIYEDIEVSFSGGKDSTALLLCCIEVAKELGRLPVKAFFYDEEAIHPPTIEYVQRVYDSPEVDLKWYCIPIKHRNACSNEQPFWHCWNPSEKNLWTREMPECAITEHDSFKFGMSMQDFGRAHFKNTNKVVVQGIRTEESLRRYRVVAMKTEENYISKPEKGVYFAFPIYDWSSKDVWRLVKIKDADYNRTYDIFNRTEQYGHLLNQRVCPPYGEEPLRGLHLYAECFPEMWAKMINRVKGARTAAKYGNTELYSTGFRPEHTSWRDHVNNILETYNKKDAVTVTKLINSCIRSHKKATDEPIPENDPHIVSGLSWKFMSKVVTRGDFKGRITQDLTGQSQKAQNKAGITKEEAIKLHGKQFNK
tara:strand:- start:1550 stop:2719 length:1170 start_codon:yes stop_codon:yes gene_type:complete